MKKAVVLMFLLLAMMVVSSCMVEVRRPEARWAVVNTYGNVNVIKVWGVEGLSGETVTTLQSGTRVKILMVKPRSILIELPNGASGWVNRRHFGADLVLVNGETAAAADTSEEAAPAVNNNAEASSEKPAVETSNPVAEEAVPQYSIGISNGLLFRFLSKNWSGIEIPLALSYSTSNSGQVMNSSISSGCGLVLPLKIIGGLHVNFIPELTGGYARTYSMTSNTEYNGNTKLDETVLLRNSGYTITGGVTFKLEVEYFIGHLISFLPGDISIGGNVALSGSENYSETYSQTYDTHIYTVDNVHTCFFGVNSTLVLTGTSLSTLVIRYYF